MSGMESPLPPFYAPPKLSFENVIKLKFAAWALWNASCVCILPVTATLYGISSAWNKFAGTPISNRDARHHHIESQVKPNIVPTDTQFDAAPANPTNKPSTVYLNNATDSKTPHDISSNGVQLTITDRQRPSQSTHWKNTRLA